MNEIDQQGLAASWAVFLPGNEVVYFFGPRISESLPGCLHPQKSAVLGPEPERAEIDFFSEPKRASVGLRDLGDVVELKQGHLFVIGPLQQ